MLCLAHVSLNVVSPVHEVVGFNCFSEVTSYLQVLIDHFGHMFAASILLDSFKSKLSAIASSCVLDKYLYC